MGLNIESSRFGQLQVDESQLLEFVSPVIGFENVTHYALFEHEPESPFFWLHAIEDKDLAFVITNPTDFGLSYAFEIPTEDAEKLGLEKVEDVLIYTLVTVPDDEPNKLTANLKAPIVINQQNKKAMQLVIPNDQYAIKQRLIPDELIQQQTTANV